jgi:hypothetical protein
MKFVANTPTIKVLAKKEFLTQGKEIGLEEAYLVGVKSTNNGPIHFTVHLESGAIFSSLPITALLCDKYNKNISPFNIPLEKAQPYSCLDGEINVIQYDYFKNYTIETKNFGSGVYLFTIDYRGNGLSDDPEQFKTHNIIALDSGDLVALPNNEILAVDDHFTKSNGFPAYKRNNKYYLAGS